MLRSNSEFRSTTCSRSGGRIRTIPPSPLTWRILAIRGSGAHQWRQSVARSSQSPNFSGAVSTMAGSEVPVTHVTNGVHTPTWDSAEADRLWEAACGKDRWRGRWTALESDFRSVSDFDLWQLRAAARNLSLHTFANCTLGNGHSRCIFRRDSHRPLRCSMPTR